MGLVTDADHLDARQERIGRNEALFRDVNERLKGLNEAFDPFVEEAEFVCECGDVRCIERISLPLTDYERIRADPTAFVMRAGHEERDVEYVERGGAWVVVRKRPRAPAELAAREDPRR